EAGVRRARVGGDGPRDPLEAGRGGQALPVVPAEHVHGVVHDGGDGALARGRERGLGRPLVRLLVVDVHAAHDLVQGVLPADGPRPGAVAGAGEGAARLLQRRPRLTAGAGHVELDGGEGPELAVAAEDEDAAGLDDGREGGAGGVQRPVRILVPVLLAGIVVLGVGAVDAALAVAAEDVGRVAYGERGVP